MRVPSKNYKPTLIRSKKSIMELHNPPNCRISFKKKSQKKKKKLFLISSVECSSFSFKIQSFLLLKTTETLKHQTVFNNPSRSDQ